MTYEQKPDMVQDQTSTVPLHPGTILLATLESRGIRLQAFALRLGIRPQRLSDILRGKRPITTKISALLAAALKGQANYWLDLQRAYEKGLLDANPEFQKHLQLVKQNKTHESTYRVGLRYTNDQRCAGFHERVE